MKDTRTKKSVCPWTRKVKAQIEPLLAYSEQGFRVIHPSSPYGDNVALLGKKIFLDFETEFGEKQG